MARTQQIVEEIERHARGVAEDDVRPYGGGLHLVELGYEPRGRCRVPVARPSDEHTTLCATGGLSKDTHHRRRGVAAQDATVFEKEGVGRTAGGMPLGHREKIEAVYEVLDLRGGMRTEPEVCEERGDLGCQGDDGMACRSGRIGVQHRTDTINGPLKRDNKQDGWENGWWSVHLV